MQSLKKLLKKAHNTKIKNLEDKIPNIDNLANTAALNAKINEVQNEIPTITNLATSASLNAKINEVKGEIPGIINLSTTAVLTTVENKIRNISDLIKKADYDAGIKNVKDKYFITSDYNKFTNNILDAKITAKTIVNESGLNEKIKH